MNWNNSRTGCAVTECHTAAESEQQPEAWINPRDGSVMRLISVAAVPAALMAALCIVIQQAWTGLWAHLVLGGLACLVTILLAGLLLMPGQIAAWRGSLAGAHE